MRDALLLVEHHGAQAALWSRERFEVAYVSLKAPDKELSEDAMVAVEIDTESLVVCVIDGMGGMQNGRAAAAESARAIHDQIQGHAQGMSRRASLVEGFERAHAAVSSACPGGGATAVAAVITPNFVQTVHAGDAEALIFGQRGKLKLRTVPQSPVGYAVHAGLLSEADALVHPERHLVSNGIGIHGMTIQVGPKVKFARRDTLVLASDGLTDNAFEAEIIEALRKGPPARQLDRLIELTRERMASAISCPDQLSVGKPDDLTVAGGAAPDVNDARWQTLRARAVRTSLCVAALLAITKLGAAFLSGSVAVLSSLADSLADVAASGLALWSVNVAHRPADEEHRFGHGRAEALSSLVQSALVAASGVFVLYSGVSRFLEPEELEHTRIALGVMVLSCVGSASIVAVQAWTLGQVKSLAIQADSLHYKGDLLANLSVIAAIVITERAGVPWFDPLVGVLIASYLFVASIAIMRRSIDQLMDRELPQTERERIEAIVEADPETFGLHDLRTRSLGQGAHIELHLELDGGLDLFRAHDITDRVEQALHAAFPRSQVTIHTEPHGLDDERLDDLVRSE